MDNVHNMRDDSFFRDNIIYSLYEWDYVWIYLFFYVMKLDKYIYKIITMK